MRRFPGFCKTLAITLAAVGVVGPGCDQPSAFQTMPPRRVTVQKPLVQSVPIYLEENGETESVDQAMVKARVRGLLTEVPQASEDVTKGTVLFVIEKKEYIAALNSAKALVAAAKADKRSAEAAVDVAQARITATDAAIKVAQAEFKRLDSLLKQKAISQSEWDSARANLDTATAAGEGSLAAKTLAEADVNTAEAALEKANADLEQAQLNLDWTDVVAPIDGRITQPLVKQGNMVENGTELIEITRNNPIWANFNISERFLLNLDRQAGAQRKVKPNTIPVSLKRSGDPDFLFEGFLDYVGPRVDQDTGTLQLRAIFDNDDPDKMLLPGLFVRVRVQIDTYEDARLIPERAVSRDPAGTFVYLVDQDNKAIRRNVVVGAKYQDMLVIESGIEPSDEVIVDGIQRVQPGVEVDPG